MVYQELYLGNPPYLLAKRCMTPVDAHRHPEIEILYCIEGKYDLLIGRQKYTLKKGDVALIGSMMSHEVPETEYGPSAKVLVIEVGPVILGDYFNVVAGESFKDAIFSVYDEEYSEIQGILEETVALMDTRERFSSLILSGNVYRIYALAFKRFATSSQEELSSNNNSSVTVVANAIDFIYNNYNKKFTVGEIAETLGYSKSNFCKIFKNITGDTFHNVLNSHRIKIACLLIKNGEFTLNEIAYQVGFADAKGFHKVFKSFMGITPGEYKKSN